MPEEITRRNREIPNNQRGVITIADGDTILLEGGKAISFANFKDIILTGVGGGGGSITNVVATDANFTAAADKRYILNNGVATTTRTIDLGSLGESDKCEILHKERNYGWNFVGATLYDFYGEVVENALRENSYYIIVVLDGKVTAIN